MANPIPAGSQLAQFAEQTPPLVQNGGRRSFARHWLWLIPTAVLVLFAAGLLLLLVLLPASVIKAMKSSEAYSAAMTTASRDPRVLAALGSPVVAGAFVTGSIHVVGSTGGAELAIPISGPRGSAAMHVTASKAAGKWSFSELSVTKDGTAAPIDLLSPPPVP